MSIFKLMKSVKITELKSQLSRHLREWSRSSMWVSSELIRLEGLRTIDRARLRLRLPDRAVVARRAAFLEHLRFEDILFATHDEELAVATTAMGFHVLRVTPRD